MPSQFIAIEGLDGSGKSTAAAGLAKLLEEKYNCKVKLTYEPNNPSAAGQYIRDVLTKKITQFHPRVLPLAFAANRLDHNARIIQPWLNNEEGNRIVLTDRYYLSSLVYQSSDDFPMPEVMRLNEMARKPDFILFVNVSEEICYERINKRNQPRELFEENFGQTKTKFLAAIDFLRSERNEKIIEVDGSLSKEKVVDQMLEIIKKESPDLFE